MPKARDNRLSIFPDRRAEAEAAEECRAARFPKVVPNTLADELNVVRRDTYRDRGVSSTWLCEDGRFRFLDTCDWRHRRAVGRPCRERRRGARRRHIRKETR